MASVCEANERERERERVQGSLFPSKEKSSRSAVLLFKTNPKLGARARTGREVKKGRKKKEITHTHKLSDSLIRTLSLSHCLPLCFLKQQLIFPLLLPPDFQSSERGSTDNPPPSLSFQPCCLPSPHISFPPSLPPLLPLPLPEKLPLFFFFLPQPEWAGQIIRTLRWNTLPAASAT